MATLTVRNIPEDTLEKIRLCSVLERRSLNNQIIITLDSGVQHISSQSTEHTGIINPETQIALWEKLLGQWNDTRSTKKIVADVMTKRSRGRSIEL